MYLEYPWHKNACTFCSLMCPILLWYSIVSLGMPMAPSVSTVAGITAAWPGTTAARPGSFSVAFLSFSPRALRSRPYIQVIKTQLLTHGSTLVYLLAAGSEMGGMKIFAARAFARSMDFCLSAQGPSPQHPAGQVCTKPNSSVHGAPKNLRNSVASARLFVSPTFSLCVPSRPCPVSFT